MGVFYCHVSFGGVIRLNALVTPSPKKTKNWMRPTESFRFQLTSSSRKDEQDIRGHGGMEGKIFFVLNKTWEVSQQKRWEEVETC